MSRPVLVYGAGALGSLLGALLSRRAAVRLLTRAAQARAIRAQGGVRLQGGAPGLYTVEVTERIGALAPSTLVLVTVKAFDLEAALRALAPSLDDSHVVVVLQNGLGIRTLARRVLGRDDVIRGVTFMAASQLEPGQVAYNATGKSYFAPHPELVALWRSAGMPAVEVEDILTYVWRKLAINAVINPLSALLDVPNGALVQLQSTARELVRELVQVAVAEGQPLEVDETYAKVMASMRQTARNPSSMLQDVRAGRRTEIDWINGAVVRLGAQHGLAVPRHLQLVELVHFLEERAAARTLAARLAT